MNSSCQMPASRPLLFLPLALILGGLTAAGCSDQADFPETGLYENGEVTPGGTGRYYMGREIGGVMSHLDAARLDRPEREAEQRTDLLLDLLPVSSGGSPVIADIGAGSGYMTTRLATRFPHAQILAIDIQPEMLALVEARAIEKQLRNVSVVLATEKNSGLQADSTDLILMVDSYHEFLWPREYMLNLQSALRPDGEIVVVEQARENSQGGLVATHRMTADQLEREMRAAGLRLTGSSAALPRQHLLRFGRAPTPPPAN